MGGGGRRRHDVTMAPGWPNGRSVHLSSLRVTEEHPSFSLFGPLDEMSVDMITEKVHRVLRVIEINQTLTDLPVFWNWLYGVKLPKLTQEAMCAPKCRASTTVINCSVCQEVELNCWNMKTCWPNQKGCKVGGIKRLNRKAEFYSRARPRIKCKSGIYKQVPTLFCLNPRLPSLSGHW
ncbi:sperm-egg fusion protein TMEM95-like isoform X4 [Scyliorhinus canicula]|uniref:sperm-egg fusion protein TMEM95-like isoform X4 n=1 Tax=Scyliorhinus canicula TaxID=7830 RepID=UPI0018F39898|nr:sperm-egg fusion protein TMEM95-like isoform X4 [Scyliorhinus canicula]